MGGFFLVFYALCCGLCVEIVEVYEKSRFFFFVEKQKTTTQKKTFYFFFLHKKQNFLRTLNDNPNPSKRGKIMTESIRRASHKHEVFGNSKGLGDTSYVSRAEVSFNKD